MEIKMSLKSFILILIFIIVCIIVGFVTGSIIYYEKGKRDMFDKFIIEEKYEFKKYNHQGSDIIGIIGRTGAYII